MDFEGGVKGIPLSGAWTFSQKTTVSLFSIRRNVSPQTRVLDKQKSLSFRGLCWFFGNRLYLEKLRFFIFTGTCFLYQRWPWKKIIQKAEIIIVYVLRNLSEKQIKILKGIQSIYFGCFNQAVQDSNGLWKFMNKKSSLQRQSINWFWLI